jgi:hypothetical protein
MINIVSRGIPSRKTVKSVTINVLFIETILFFVTYFTISLLQETCGYHPAGIQSLAWVWHPMISARLPVTYYPHPMVANVHWVIIEQVTPKKKPAGGIRQAIREKKLWTTEVVTTVCNNDFSRFYESYYGLMIPLRMA